MYRTKEQIIVSVLETCLTCANKTVIVYKSKLNFATVVPYLDSLINREFIAVIEGSPRRYETTGKGKKLLAMLKEIDQLL